MTLDDLLGMFSAASANPQAGGLQALLKAGNPMMAGAPQQMPGPGAMGMPPQMRMGMPQQIPGAPLGMPPQNQLPQGMAGAMPPMMGQPGTVPLGQGAPGMPAAQGTGAMNPYLMQLMMALRQPGAGGGGLASLLGR